MILSTMHRMEKLMTKTFDFKTQLAVGDRGQELFMEYYPEAISIWPEHDGDFITKSGQKIELKTDTYNMDKTDNFFIERYSDLNKKSPGSVWQAHGHGCEIFVYYFVRHDTWFIFRDLPKLIERLESLTNGKGLVYIKNRAWTTAGYKVKRKDLEDLYEQFTFKKD